MQFPVPQFLDMEDRIIGPFGVKQFGFLFGGGLIVLALFRTLKLSIPFFILALPIALLTLFVSFGKFNGKPIYDAFPILLKFMSAPKQMVFHKDAEEVGEVQIKSVVETAPAQVLEEPAQSRLKKLALMLDQKNVEEEEIATRFTKPVLK